MSVPEILFIVALVLALIEEFQAQGRSLLGWAVVAVCVGLLWGALR
jgi:hypothetical protein